MLQDYHEYDEAWPAIYRWNFMRLTLITFRTMLAFCEAHYQSYNSVTRRQDLWRDLGVFTALYAYYQERGYGIREELGQYFSAALFCNRNSIPF